MVLIPVLIMLRITSVCLFAAFLQVVTSEPPMQCRHLFPKDVKPTDCCEFPMLFKEEDLAECNIDRTMKKRTPLDCSAHICLFKKYNLLKDDDKVDREAAAAYFYKWVENNADFKDVVTNIKKNCLQDDLPGPDDICDPDKVVLCHLVTIFMDCPTWNDSDNCNKIKDHITECKPYYD